MSVIPKVIALIMDRSEGLARGFTLLSTGPQAKRSYNTLEV